MLPPEYRRSSSRAILIPTLVLAGLLLLVAGAMFGWSRYADKKYLAGINAEIARVEPVANRAMALDRQIGKARAQTQLLDRFRAQTRLDLDALNELTRLIEPHVPDRAFGPADRTAGVDQRDRSEPRNCTHYGRGSRRRAARTTTGLLAVFRELRPGLHQSRE